MKQRERIYALLRAALWQENIEESLFSGISPEEWNELYTMAVQQGVTAIVWDGVLRLPADCLPSRELRLRWGINTEAIEKRYARYCNAASQLAALFAEKGIPMMQLKGTGLATCYPIPEHREGGDIDIYLFGEYAKANSMLKERGISVKTNEEKHHKFYFQGIPVENHIHFLNVHLFKTDRILEQELLRINEASDKSCQQIILPSPDFNALFLSRHATTHFVAGGIVLRHLCDWVCFLARQGNGVNAERFREMMTQNGLCALVDTFTAIAVDKLGLPTDKALLFERYPELQQDVEADIFEHVKKTFQSKNPIRIFIYKCQRFMRRKWKSDLLYPGQFGKIMWKSIVLHICHPETLFRM